MHYQHRPAVIHNFTSVIDTSTTSIVGVTDIGNACIASVSDRGEAPSEPLTVCQGIKGTISKKNVSADITCQ